MSAQHTVPDVRSPDPRRSPARPAGPLLEVTGLAKSFGATRALRSCSCALRAGEVHALVGENGSGKSTLVKILSGVHRPDDGLVALDGTALPARRTPRATQAAGIVTVFQEVLVVGSQTVLENVWLGVDGLFRTATPTAEKRTRASAVLAELMTRVPPLDAPAESLTLSERQACCIARALLRSPRVLILDEATSALDVETRDRLFAAVRRLSGGGSAVLFISHRMDEIEELADRVTVLRSGESVVTLDRGEADTAALVRHMTGSDRLTAGVRAVSGAARIRGEVVLQARGVRLAPESAAIDLDVHAGELLGLAGLEGHGQDAFLDALRGAGAWAGDVVVDGITLDSPRRAFGAGVVFVPRDRRAESLFPTLSIGENFALPTLVQDSRAGVVDWRRTAQRLAGYVERLAIRLGSHRQPVTVLSGGNQQKVVISRWLAARPRVLLLNDPTRGIDLAAKRDLYGALEQLAGQGVAVVMLSTEVDEHVELMDRVLVFREGAVAAEIAGERLDRTGLVGAFFGSDEGDGRDA